MEKKDENSNRRRFIRKLVGLAALGGIASLVLGQPLKKVSAEGETVVVGGEYTTATSRTLIQGDVSAGTYGVIEGINTATSGSAWGLHGESNSTSGIGVIAVGTAPGGIGVSGNAGDPSAIPIVASGAGNQIANLQEWRVARLWGPPFYWLKSVIDKDGKLGIGTSAPLYACDVRTGSTAAQMHFASSYADSGGYFVSAADGNFYVSGGAAYNGTSWIAKATSAYIIGGDASGIRMFYNTGLTPGGSFNPTQRMRIDPAGNVRAAKFITGDIVFANGIKATEEGSGLAFVNRKGTKVAVLDSEGNFHIKGRVIQDL